MDAVIGIDQHEDAGCEKAYVIPSAALSSRYIRKHGKRKHHAGDGHVAARPRFEAVIAACEVGDHLPPAAELANRIVQSDQVFITGREASCLSQAFTLSAVIPAIRIAAPTAMSLSGSLSSSRRIITNGTHK